VGDLMGTQDNFLYRPAYGAKGTTEYTSFDEGLSAADAAITSLSASLSSTTFTATTITATTISGTTISGGNIYGTAQIKIDDLLSGDDNTDLNASTAAHGLLPKLGGGTANYLRADGSWSPPGGTGDMKADGTVPFTSEFSGTDVKFSGTVKAATISATTVSATDVKATTITATTLSGSVSADTVKATTITGTTLSGTILSSTNVYATTLTGTTFSGTDVKATEITATTLCGNLSGTATSAVSANNSKLLQGLSASELTGAVTFNLENTGYIWEDFIGIYTGTPTQAQNPWEYKGTPTVIAGTGGIIRLAGDSSDTACLRLAITHTQLPFYTQKNPELWMRAAQYGTTANITRYLGLGTAQMTAAPASGVYFRWKTGGAYVGVCRNSAVESSVSAATSASNGTFAALRATVTSASVTFYVNGASIGTVTSNIPSAAGAGLYFSMGDDSTSDSNGLDIDYVYITYNR